MKQTVLSSSFLKVLTVSALILVSWCLKAQEMHESTIFRHLEEGLTHSNVTALYEDSEGFIWVGTWSGINRYDGLTFRNYERISGDSTSLVAPWVWDIQEDSNGDLWIATGGGLSRYDRDTDQFESFKAEGRNPAGLTDNFIQQFYFDGDRTLWMASQHGLMLLDTEEKKVKKTYLPDQFVRTIVMDSEGRMWLAAESLYVLEADGSLIDVMENPDNDQSLPATNIRSMAMTLNGDIWFGTWGNGLYRLAKSDQSKNLVYQHYLPDKKNENSLTHVDIINVTGDSKGNLWIGTENGGLDRFNVSSGRFYHHRNNPKDVNSLNSTSAWRIMEDKVGRIWVGTYGKGVDIIDPLMKEFVKVTTENSQLAGKKVKAMTEDSNGDIWFGIDGMGLNRYDVSKKEFSNFSIIPKTQIVSLMMRYSH